MSSITRAPSGAQNIGTNTGTRSLIGHNLGDPHTTLYAIRAILVELMGDISPVGHTPCFGLDMASAYRFKLIRGTIRNILADYYNTPICCPGCPHSIVVEQSPPNADHESTLTIYYTRCAACYAMGRLISSLLKKGQGGDRAQEAVIGAPVFLHFDNYAIQATWSNPSTLGQVNEASMSRMLPTPWSEDGRLDTVKYCTELLLEESGIQRLPCGNPKNLISNG
ncbi:hypothetical protein FE257_003794 [Aspergillus nanangensis]|uniref:Uncharacterized protein n=1 Tax=Aspergillus nanangensis TaxID=2582783 RepID=A0AAD4GMN4_ASPNN|nr:hypothetical protein FE257_003794 [Aspergillus nanangensis]